MKLYWCKTFNTKDDSHKLLKRALEDYLNLEKETLPTNFEIKKAAGGKPYIQNYPCYFNISHSKNLWVCAMADKEIGVDVELVQPKNHEKLVQKYFTEDEARFLASNPKEMFYQLWTAKEAHSKLLGESIFNNLKVPMVEQGKFIEKRLYEKDDKTCWIGYSIFNGFKEDDQFKCTVAQYMDTENDEIQIELKEI